MTGVEALLRWQHPVWGNVPPDEFIPLAEHTGLIRPLTRFVLETAVHQCAAWQAAGTPVVMAVNVSMRNLLEPELADVVARLLVQANLPAGLLKIEVTESAIIADPERALHALDKLVALGLSISVDDFGTGYSSLTRLRRLPVHEVKIDRAFVRAPGRQHRRPGHRPRRHQPRPRPRAAGGRRGRRGRRRLGRPGRARLRPAPGLPAGPADVGRGHDPVARRALRLVRDPAAAAAPEPSRSWAQAPPSWLHLRSRQVPAPADGACCTVSLGWCPSCDSLWPRSNPTVGDIEGNADRVLSWARHAADQGAHVVAFPEMVLTGYPVEDLALRRSFVRASRAALDDLAQRLAADGLGDMLVVVGYLDGAADAVPVLGTPAGAPQNAAGLLHGGDGRRSLRQAPPAQLRRVRRVPLLRARQVPDRRARPRRGRRDRHLRGHLAGGRPGRGHPGGRGRTPLVINGSPYERNKDDVRLDLVRRRAAAAGCTLAYVNMVGGQDELVFDGDSIVVGPDGTVLARAPQFDEGCLVVDLDLPAATADAGDQASHVESVDHRAITITRVTVSERTAGEPTNPSSPGSRPGSTTRPRSTAPW